MPGHHAAHDMQITDLVGIDPGDAETFTIDRFGVVIPMITSSSGETRTLARPIRVGNLVTLVLKTDGGGDVTLTVTGGYNQADATSVTFGDVGDTVMFHSIEEDGVYYWRVLQYEGTGLTIAERTVTSLVATSAVITTLTATTLKLAVGAVVAAGSTIGQGGDLAAGINIVSAADNTKCVDLPTGAEGTMVIVISATVNRTLPVFPASTASIDNAADNAAVTIGNSTAHSSAIFVADDSGDWHSILGDIT